MVYRSLLGAGLLLASVTGAHAQGFTFANEPIPQGAQLGTYAPGQVAIQTQPGTPVYYQPGTAPNYTVVGGGALQPAQAGVFTNGAVPAGNGRNTSSSGDQGGMIQGAMGAAGTAFGPSYPPMFGLTGGARPGQQYGGGYPPSLASSHGYWSTPNPNYGRLPGYNRPAVQSFRSGPRGR